MDKDETISVVLGMLIGALLTSFYITSPSIVYAVKAYGIPIVIDILVTYGIISTYLARKDKKQWGGIKVRAICSARELHNWLYTVLNTACTSSGKEAETMLKNAAYRQNQLQRLVDMAGVGLGSELLAKMLEFSEAVDDILPRLKFLIDMKAHSTQLSAQGKKGLYVIDSPLEQLNQISNLVNSFTDEDLKEAKELKSADSLRATWETYKDQINLRDDIGNPMPFKGCSVVQAFNIDTLTRSKIATKKGDVIHTYHY